MSDQNKIADPIEYVSKNTDIVMCDGGSGDLGHPAVYFKFGKKKEIICNYCNKKFIKKEQKILPICEHVSTYVFNA